MTERKLRAEALLEKLRNRKVPASVQTPLMPPHIAAVAVVVELKADGPADNVSPTASDKQAETRKIQEDMELLRLGIQPHHVMPVASITVPPADEKPEVFKSLTARESELTSDLVTKERVRRSQDTATTKFELVRRRAFDLPLPDRLTKLEAIFQAIEHTLMFTHSQGCAWIFHRHRKSVENSCGYTFTLRHLAQIVYIYPDSYELKPTRVAYQGSQVDSIEVSPKPGGAATDTDAESAKSLGGVDPTSAFATARFAVEQIERRRRTFREQLLDYVDTYHKMFATERNNIGSNAVTVPGWRQIKRWHEDFSLNGDVPDLPQAELPLRCTTNLARPDKERIRWLLGQAASPASKETASAAAEGDTGGTAKADPPAAVAEGPCVGELELLTAGATQQKETKDAPVSKVSALLERIRAKEQRRKQEAMLGVSPEKMTERAMLSRLPGIADSVSYIFYAQRKSVLPLSLVCERLSYSARMPLSKDECKEHITKLAGIVPDWCRIETVSQVPMVRIIRTKSVKLVKQDLEDKIRALAM
ncbi:hypothetical protein EV182_002919 [Spiromyces aspiralis]|uniref:Uncharacterized protein n=1 Tax=Spiromyces aspiralis TaxID=68401 RepID=A0ACC1HS00_9FUNG|nr:hypothetical protein EV182_002919 [Spiromyces aspiralis]